MRFLSFPAFAAFSFCAACAAPAPAQTAPPKAQAAPPSRPAAPDALGKPRTWIVENHNRTVSLREQGGKTLFSKKITTDNVTAEVSLDSARKGKIILTLKEAAGKKLYTFLFPRPEHGSFGFEFFAKGDGKDASGKPKATSSGSSFSITPGAAPDEPEDDTGNKALLTLVIGPDNLLSSGSLVSGSDRTVFVRKGLKMTATSYKDGVQTDEQSFEINLDPDGAKGVSGTLIANGKETTFATIGGDNDAAVLRDEKGEVSAQVIKEDGKEYVVFTMGERKLRMEGANYKIDLKDGIVTITPDSIASPTEGGDDFTGESVVMRDEKGEVSIRGIRKSGKDYTDITMGGRTILVEGKRNTYTFNKGVVMLKTDAAPDPAKRKKISKAAGFHPDFVLCFGSVSYKEGFVSCVFLVWPMSPLRLRCFLVSRARVGRKLPRLLRPPRLPRPPHLLPRKSASRAHGLLKTTTA